MLLFWLLVAVNTGVMCWSPVCDLVLRTFMVEEEWTVVVLCTDFIIFHSVLWF